MGKNQLKKGKNRFVLQEEKTRQNPEEERGISLGLLKEALANSHIVNNQIVPYIISVLFCIYRPILTNISCYFDLINPLSNFTYL